MHVKIYVQHGVKELSSRHRAFNAESLEAPKDSAGRLEEMERFCRHLEASQYYLHRGINTVLSQNASKVWDLHGRLQKVEGHLGAPLTCSSKACGGLTYEHCQPCCQPYICSSFGMCWEVKYPEVGCQVPPVYMLHLTSWQSISSCRLIYARVSLCCSRFMTSC